MHWIKIDDCLPIREPYSMRGFATLKIPGEPPRVEHGVFHSGKNVYDWQRNPRSYMVKAQYEWPEHLNISKYDVVFCKNECKDEKGIHYAVYPQPWITAWMPEPIPFQDNLPEGFEVSVNGLKYFVEVPDLEMSTEHYTMSRSELYECAQEWVEKCKDEFTKHLKGD